jgi:hypothetical protein
VTTNGDYGMVRNALIFLGTCGAILFVFAWSENEIASSFQSCISKQASQNSPEHANDQGQAVVAIIRAQAICSLRLIDQHNGFFAALAAIAVAAFTFTLWVSTDKQARLTAQNTKLAREEFIATHRPKIKIHAVEITRTEVDGDNRIGASILCFNVGESVAKNVEVRGEIFMGPRFAIDVQRPIVRRFPEVLSGQKFRAEMNSDWQVVYAAAGKRTGIHCYCIGWIAYWDETGHRRETGFCFQTEFSNEGDRWVSAGKPEYEYDY